MSGKNVTVAEIYAEEEGSNSKKGEVINFPTPPDLAAGDCLVCGDKASGFHYGVFSCEGCKGFFRRSVTRGHVKACRWGNQCSMDLYTRRRCPECRLRSCKAAGMRPDCLLTQAQCRSKLLWRKHKSKATASSGRPEPSTAPSPDQSGVPDQAVQKNSLFSSCQSLSSADAVKQQVPLSQEGGRPMIPSTENDGTCPILGEVMSSLADAAQRIPTFSRSESAASDDMLSFFAVMDSDLEMWTDTAVPVDKITNVEPIVVGEEEVVVAAAPATEKPAESEENEMAQTLLSLQTCVSTSKAKPSDPEVCTSQDFSQVAPVAKLFASPDILQKLEPQHQTLIQEMVQFWKQNVEPERKHAIAMWEDTEACKTFQEKQLRFVEHGNKSVQRYISFCRTLRGFNNLCVEDQITVVKGSIFETFIMRGPTFCKETGLDVNIAQRLTAMVYTQEFTDNLMKWYEGMWKLKVDPITIQLLCCAVILSPDRAELRDPSVLEKAQEQYITCLQEYCRLAYPDQPVMFARLMGKLTEVREVGKTCESSLRPECATMIKAQPLVSEIWQRD